MLKVNITKRNRSRKLKSGKVVKHSRYVVQWRDPQTDARRQSFFELRKDAEEKRAEVIASVMRGNYSSQKKQLTVAEAVTSWLEGRRSAEIRQNTYDHYVTVSHYIIGPLLARSDREKRIRSGKGTKPEDARYIECLGKKSVFKLTTREIRAWHQVISAEVGLYSANKAKQFLKASLDRAAEDCEFRPPAMPTGLPRRRDKVKKDLLTQEQVKTLLRQAHSDPYGIYYAFPFYVGTRPSEQLGLLWEDVDFENNRIHIRRMQEKNGVIVELTKTASGKRSVGIPQALSQMLREWKLRCPRDENNNLHRVFPGIGWLQRIPPRRVGGGGPLLYCNFRTRFWNPALKRASLPHVGPHTARHSFISMLQMKGVEVAMAAKLAGHKNPSVTLGYYTHAMSDMDEAIDKLAEALALN